MIKKLVAHGNSAALIIDKPILDVLKVDMKTPLEITTDSRNLIVSPVKDTSKKRNSRLRLRRLTELMERH